MNRRVWCGSLATTAAWVGVVTAQTPPAAAPAGSSAAAGPVYVMKTAGQPERRVQVVKSEKLPDGTFLTDVKDLATGVVYTLTNPAVLGTPAATTPAPKAVASTTGTLPPANTYVPPAATTGAPRPLFGGSTNQTAAVTTPNATAPFSSAPRPIFGSFPNQQTAQQPGLRTAGGEKLVPADGVPPGANPHGLPQARTRKTDPLLAGMASTPAAMTARTPFVPGPNDPPSLLGKYLGAEQQSKDLPQPRVGTHPPAAAAANLGAPPTLLPPPAVAFNPMAAPKAVPPAPIPKPPVPVVKAPAPAPVATGELTIPSIAPDAKPSAATGIFDSQPAAPVQASVVIPPIEATAGPSRILPPITEPPPAATQAETTLPMAAPAPAPEVVTPAPAVTPAPIEFPATKAVATPAPIEIPLPKVVPLPVPAAVPVPAVEFVPKLPAPPTGFPTPPINPAAAAVPAATPGAAIPIPTVAEASPTPVAALPADVLTMIDGLKNHRRPSFRMENATALAESQYSHHPDVLAALVEVAKNDVAGVVRGHCINQLTMLGYSDATYLKSLVTWESDSEPAVRRAATAARTKLSGR